jgi:hypothetical protein
VFLTRLPDSESLRPPKQAAMAGRVLRIPKHSRLGTANRDQAMQLR